MSLPLLLVLAGLVALAAASLVLRSFGPRYRVGRLLAATPRVSVAEAIALAAGGRRAYVRVEGRIDSDEEFEDADHRPLVLRRTTLASKPSTGRGGSWVTFERSVESVPFVLREGLDELAIDGRAVADGDGLVVVPRESVGQVADLGERAPAGVPAEAPARLVIEHVSSVEHATALGVPVRGTDGLTHLQAGLGRPVVLTTLADDEAMRVLAAGELTRPRVAAVLLVLAGLLVLVGGAWWLVDALGSPAAAYAASPQPTSVPGNDTRSPGAGPGLVGDPAFAIVAVLAIAVVAVVATTAWVRMTPRRPSGPS